MGRKTVASQIRAKVVYPKFESPKKASAEFVNVVLSDDEALNLAKSLIQGSRDSHEINLRVSLKAAKKSGLHGMSVTYDEKQGK